LVVYSYILVWGKEADSDTIDGYLVIIVSDMHSCYCLKGNKYRSFLIFKYVLVTAQNIKLKKQKLFLPSFDNNVNKPKHFLLLLLLAKFWQFEILFFRKIISFVTSVTFCPWSSGCNPVFSIGELALIGQTISVSNAQGHFGW
jgi:hypothetical protein